MPSSKAMNDSSQNSKPMGRRRRSGETTMNTTMLVHSKIPTMPDCSLVSLNPNYTLSTISPRYADSSPLSTGADTEEGKEASPRGGGGDDAVVVAAAAAAAASENHRLKGDGDCQRRIAPDRTRQPQDAMIEAVRICSHAADHHDHRESSNHATTVLSSILSSSRTTAATTATSDYNHRAAPAASIPSILQSSSWVDLGRPAAENDPSQFSSPRLRGEGDRSDSGGGRAWLENEAAIGRNTMLLEHLLSEALRHDAAAASSAATASAVPGDASFTTTQIPTNDDVDNNNNSNDTILGLPFELRQELRQYVARIASHYRPVAFHSFGHASHAMLSATKLVFLLKKQQQKYPRHNCGDKVNSQREENAREENTNGHDGDDDSLQDPWLHFAIAFAALIHDVDHRGVPNMKLLAQNHSLAVKYGSEKCMNSFAEWNSVDVGLGILEEDEQFESLKRAILDGPRGQSLRDMIRDLILCTDIASTERKQRGMCLWGIAFPIQNGRTAAAAVTKNNNVPPRVHTKEAIRAIADQIMQAADVSHTMQHWDTFLKWNRCLYQEILSAYRNGKANTPGFSEIHPAKNWYAGQIGFYNFYVIPLAERLGLCGAFEEADGKQFLALARRNRDRWISEGEQVTKEMVESTDKMTLPPPSLTSETSSSSLLSDAAALPTTSTSTTMTRARRMSNSYEYVQAHGYVNGHRSAVFDDEESPSLSDDGAVVLRRSSSEQSIESLSDVAPKNREPMASLGDEAVAPSYHSSRISLESLGSFTSLVAVPEREEPGFASIASEMGASTDAVNLSVSSSDSSVASAAKSEGWAFLNRPDKEIRRSWVSAMGELAEQPIDKSVDAIVPRILVRQVLNLLQKGGGNGVRASIKDEIERYRKTGSIHRYRGALLFVDISGFTNLAQMYPIEDFKTFINRYFTKIINLVVSFGGEVVKFAGDALYAVWSTLDDTTTQHNINVAKCTACGIAINAECNNYKVSKSYNRRRTLLANSVDQNYSSTLRLKPEGQGQDHVMYSIEDKNAEYEDREALLYVYCGVSEGTMAGVDVIAADRAEFFLIGKPLTDVAKAESLADRGELVISPSVHAILKEKMSSQKGWDGHIVSSALSQAEFAMTEDGYCKVLWEECPTAAELSSRFPDECISPNVEYADELVEDFVTCALSHVRNMNAPRMRTRRVSWQEGVVDKDYGKKIMDAKAYMQESSVLQQDILKLFDCHRHEATRDVHEKLSAELRRVAVIFVKIDYEPMLPVDDKREDGDILRKFQTIFQCISESISPRNGQVRQFISDDKGTVCIASFGLRGSATLNPAANAIDAAQDIRKRLSETLETGCSIGITLGKVFCGETGSPDRYEYSLLGPAVNLSARLMAKGSGSVSCDEEIKKSDNGLHTLINGGTHMLKGYKEPVPFYTPVDDIDTNADGKPKKLFVRQNEINELVDYILRKQQEMKQDAAPCGVLVTGRSGTGKSEFITGLLTHPNIEKSTFVLKTKQCFHDTPFYCFTPIIAKIVLGSETVKQRLSKMKRKMQRRASGTVIAPLVGNSKLFKGDTYTNGYDDLVPDNLTPYLALVNDFVFQGFPVFTKSEEVKRLKDDDKATKCVEVISAAITRYILRSNKNAVISIQDIDKADDYSKRLIQHLFKSKTNFIFIGSITAKSDSSSFASELDEANESHCQSIFGCTDRECREVVLEHLSKKRIFNLFKWSLRDIADQDRDLLDHPSIAERVQQLCGGIPRFAVELANAVNLQWESNSNSLSPSKEERREYFLKVLQDLPATKIEELVCFRFDHLRPEAQMVLKVASVAGFDQFSFSENLLETLVLSLSKTDRPEKVDKAKELSIPTYVGIDQEINKMFQGENFERIIEYLIEQNFLVDINADMGDVSSLDSTLYRFADADEQKIINGLMLDDQKMAAHFEVAQYYRARINSGQAMSDDESNFSEISMFPTLSWQVLHITALHYDLAGAPVQAMLFYYDSAVELARLGVRDRSHGSLLSAYLMLEKLIYNSSALQIPNISEDVKERQRLSREIVEMIGNKELPESMQMLTQEHLRFMFSGDIDSFVKCITMLTKFGQSVGTIEKEGYKFGTDIYLQAIFLLLLALQDSTFRNMMSRLSPFLGPLELKSAPKGQKTNRDGDYCIDDLSVSFPAFSGLLTFYRDSPIPVSGKQESFLANLFVAVTEENDEDVHVLRTKCILSHLYLKHGNIQGALDECEEIKKLYDHKKHSMQLVKLYGMDWALVCVGTMAGVYLFRGEFTAALDFIHFLEEQFLKLDEFASSTKVMMEQIVSSLYLKLRQFDKAFNLASGIAKTPYSYFYKPSGILQEGLTKKLHALNCAVVDAWSRGEPVEQSEEDDFGVLSILSDEDPHAINYNRPMLYSSIEALTDRGIEAIKAALCVSEIEMLEKKAEDLTQKQMQYCQAGLAHLEQSLQQKDATSDEKRTNYLSCLYQKAELLLWHSKLRLRLHDAVASKGDAADLFPSYSGSEVDIAKSVLRECESLSVEHDFPFMRLLVGVRWMELGLGEEDEHCGENILSLALRDIESSRSDADYKHAVTYLNQLRQDLTKGSVEGQVLWDRQCDECSSNETQMKTCVHNK